MNPFTGEVLWITLTPGRTDTLMLSVACPKVGEHHVTFSLSDEVYIYETVPNHRIGGAGRLFAWLALCPRPIVTVTPDPERFGFSKLTEFRSPDPTTE